MQSYRGYRPATSRRARVRSSKRFSFNKFIILNRLSRFALIGLVGGIVLFFFYFLWISRDLPTPGKLSNSDIKDSTKILDKDGDVLYSIYKEYNRLYIPLAEIPDNVEKATIATEDKDFYENQGFSLWGYARVAKDIALHGRVTGGSGITQQLVKTALLSSERSLTRKLKELVLSIQVSRKYSKDEVLELYLNNISYGGTAVGVEAASNLYFDKKAKDLTLSQAAFLAGLPQLPTYYSPYTGEDKAYVGRTKHVLRRMREEGMISREQEEKAGKEVEKFTFAQKQGNLKAPHFVMFVRRELERMFGENLVSNGNLTVTTTLDYEIQEHAEKTVEEEIDKLKGFRVGNGAAVVMDAKTGAILSMVGSRNYFDTEKEGNFNAATSLRQPGSSLKPIMYAVAFEKGFTPATLVMDLKTDFPTDTGEMYAPVNYDGEYRGPMQLRFALGNSMNVPAVKMLARVGIEPVMQKGYDMGLENWEPTRENLQNVGLSLVLGGREASLLQITSAYTAFAAQGQKAEPFAILEVKDTKGKTIYKHKEKKGEKVLSEEVAFLVSHILLDQNARSLVFGPRSWLTVAGKTVAVKTGTTDEKRDNWTIGYTPSYVVGVWVGNNDNTPMNPNIASGVTGAAPIWNRIIAEVLKGEDNEEFEQPDDVEAVEIDSFGGGLPVEGQGRRTEYFIKGTQPTTLSTIYKKVKVSKQDNNRLANEEEIKRGDYDTRDFIVFEESDPVSTDGKNRWQEAINAWVEATYKDDPKYRPPTETSDKKFDENVQGESATPTPTPSPTPTP